ncbi:ribonuclease H-like domain-containing protein [Tanacetum coccineum]
MSSDPNYKWEQLHDIDDSDLPLTPFLYPCNNHVRETTITTTTQNTDGIVQVKEKPARIIPGPTGIVQVAKLRKQLDIHEGGDESVLLTQEYIRKVVDDVGEDEDFKGGSWVSAVEFVNANGGGIVNWCLGDIKNYLKDGKLEKVVAIIKSCTLKALGDLTATLKDLLGTIPGTIHRKVINDGGYGKDTTIGIPVNGSGVGGSGLLMEDEETMKLIEEEEMDDLGLHVCENVIDQEDLYKFNEEALDLALEEEARQAQAHQEWLEK